MHARAFPLSLLLFFSILTLVAPACVMSDGEVGVAGSRPLPQSSSPTGEATESGRSELSAARGLDEATRPDDTPSPATLADGFAEVMRGDFQCVGTHLPAEPTAATRRIAGRTVYFGTDVVAPGTSVRFLDAEGAELAEVVSDDRGEFAVSVPDTVARAEVWRPGFIHVTYATTHPHETFDGDLELGAVKPADFVLVEATAGIQVDQSRGSIVARAFDCVGDTEVAGVRLAIEGAPTEVYYASSRFELSRDLDRTTESGYAYLFNLAPGTYTIAAWGLVYPGAEGAVLLNRAVVDVHPGELTVLDLYPE